jgi:RimJ/RimL family protein N-acetyltransferase
MGDRIRLRPEAATDIPTLARWFSDPEVTHWLHLSEMPRATIESETEKFERHQRDGERHDWIIETLDDTPIGGISLVGIDPVHFRAELGISIGEKEYWSGGYGTEAIRVILRHAFTDLGLNRVQLIADHDNDRAIRCYEKCGFRHEGVLRGHRLRYGKPLDMVMMGVLKSDLVSEKPPCPRCRKADRVVPIEYGYPAPDAWKDEEDGKVVLGGCVVGAVEPSHHCRRCKMDYGLAHLGAG